MWGEEREREFEISGRECKDFFKVDEVNPKQKQKE